MATVTIPPGAEVLFDPDDKRVILFDFDEVNLPAGVELSGFTIGIIPIVQQTVTALTSDNAALVSGNRKVQARFLATTAIAGDRYRVSITGVTNESPVQEKNYSIFITITER